MGLNNSQEEKVNEIFKLKIPGLAYCQYCKNYVKIFENCKLEFVKHFSEFQHLNYFVDQFQICPDKKNGGMKQEQLFMGISEDKYENIFKHVKVREAYCQLCNSYVNISYMRNVRTQFWIHFLDEDSHGHFIDQLDIKYDDIEKNNEFKELKLRSEKKILDKLAKLLAEKQVQMHSHQVEILRQQYLNQQSLDEEENHHHNQLSLQKVGEEKCHQNQLSQEKVREEEDHQNQLSLEEIEEEKSHSQVERNLELESSLEQKHEQVLKGEKNSKCAKCDPQIVLRKNEDIKKLSSTTNTPINKRLKKY